MAIQPATKTKPAGNVTTSPLPMKAAGKPVAVKNEANGEKKQRAAKGPSLTWDTARNGVLVKLIKSGVTSKSDLAGRLQSDPAFAGVEPSAFTPAKVGNHIKALHKAATEKGRTDIVAILDTVERQSRRGESLDLSALDDIDID